MKLVGCYSVIHLSRYIFTHGFDHTVLSSVNIEPSHANPLRDRKHQLASGNDVLCPTRRASREAISPRFLDRFLSALMHMTSAAVTICRRAALSVGMFMRMMSRGCE